MKKFLGIIALFLITAVLAGCLIRPPHVPPGQLKKHTAPGHMKKH